MLTTSFSFLVFVVFPLWVNCLSVSPMVMETSLVLVKAFGSPVSLVSFLLNTGTLRDKAETSLSSSSLFVVTVGDMRGTVLSFKEVVLAGKGCWAVR